MLTDRQSSIIKLVTESQDIISSSTIANELNVSTRTIINEIKSINEMITLHGANIESIPGKGYKLVINNKEKFYLYIDNCIFSNLNNNDLNNKENRINYLLTKLLISKKPVKLNYFIENLFISSSAIMVDIRMVKNILKYYDLKLVTVYNKGMVIEGSETNKRLCIIKEKINLNVDDRLNPNTLNRQTNIVSDVVVKILIDEKFLVSDVFFQNLILHIQIAILRMVEGEYLQPSEVVSKVGINGHTVDIARKVYDELSKKFYFKINDTEICNLAIYLSGNRIPPDSELITKEVDEFIYEVLKDIRFNYKFDFTNNLNLRLQLALHIPPLIIRARNNIQITNDLLSTIKHNLSLAYNFATIMKNHIEQKYNVTINSDDEIGYIAVYFSMALKQLDIYKNQKKVLIITLARNSEILLFKQKILMHYSDKISTLDVVNINDIKNQEISLYDAVFTTCKYVPESLNLEKVVKINYFIDSEDQKKIEKELSKDSYIDDIKTFLNEKFFLSHLNFTDKNKLLRYMCSKMEESYSFDEGLFEAVIRRESYGGTLFENGIVITHPIPLISEKTIVCVGIVDKPIKWDCGEAKVIFLISGAKDEIGISYGYRLISSFMSDKKEVDDLIEHQDYDYFIKRLKLMDINQEIC
jgi:Transcriptional antiterminator